eukprot:gene5093-34893_t
MGLGAGRFSEPEAKPNFWKEWHRQLQVDTNQVMHTVEDPLEGQYPVTPIVQPAVKEPAVIEPVVTEPALVAADSSGPWKPPDLPTLPEGAGNVDVDTRWLKVSTDKATGETSVRVGSRLFPVFKMVARNRGNEDEEDLDIQVLGGRVNVNGDLPDRP